MEQRLSAAVIGCGRMGAFTSEGVRRFAPACWFPLAHAEAIAAHPGLSLVALSDTNPDMLRQAAEKYAVADTFEDPLMLLQKVRPSLVGIATRTVGRADLIAAAIANGVRALHVEKPLCNSVSELAALQRLLAATDVYLTYGTVRRFFQIYRRALALCESEVYGTLREIRVNLGGASLFWTHPHAIDLILFAAGARQVTGVQAHLAEVEFGASRSEILSDPRVVNASVHFDDGVAGHITQGLGADLVLSCTGGEIAVMADGASIECYQVPEGKAYPVRQALAASGDDAAPGGTLAPVSQLVACLEGQAAAIEANATVKRDVLRGQEIALTLVQSHLENARIIAPGAVDPELVVHAMTGGRHA